MGILPRPTPRRRPPSAFMWMVALLAMGTSVVRAGAPTPADQDRRVPWATSRFAGTPDAPLPYVAEPAFPGLTFDRPVFLAQVPGSRQLVVAELGGRVVAFPEERGADRAEVVVDLAPGRPGFGSLYGLAFHPRFEENRQVFLCYTFKMSKPDGTRVSRFTASRADPPTIDPESEEVIITWPSGGHNGGCLAFGPEGLLYISTGDSGPASPPDPIATGQDLSDLLSSILRIDVDRRDPERAYLVPRDNPFVSLAGARPEIWAYGLRNPWRMSFDRATGDLWVGDVGWELWELIYRVVRGGNYGWSLTEGRQPVRPDGPRGPTPVLPPTTDHPHSEAASITGGYVYRGDRLKELIGTYVYGDYQSGKVWGLRGDGRRVELADTGLRLASFGEDLAGELFLVEHERTNQVYRLIANPAPEARRDFPRVLSESGLFASTRDQTPAPGVVAYAINAESWADGARAERFLAIPGIGRIEVGEARAPWRLPEGSVLARTVSLDVIEGDDQRGVERRRRLETQVLHREGGSWRPYTYIWNDEQTDAVLADAGGSSRTFLVNDPGPVPGGRRSQVYRFGARSECILCHNPWVEARTTVFGAQSASPLGFTSAQLDRDGGGQLERLERLGYFARPLSDMDKGPRRLADPYDEAADLETRARSYFEVNCAHCHQYNAGGSANIVLGFSQTLEQTRTIGIRPIQGAFGIDDAMIIAPGEPERSVLYYRVAKSGAGRMPRIGAQQVDVRGTRLIADWIAQLPGKHDRPSALRDDAALASLQAAPGLSADARAGAIRQLTGSTRGALTLLRSVDRGTIPGGTLREIAAQVKDQPGAEVRDLFERFLPEADRVVRLGDRIDAEEILKLPGDAVRGGRWFFAESATGCKGCHRVGGVGVGLGPDLDDIGSKYPRRELLRQVVEPSREVDPRYAVVAVATRDGQVHQGLLVEKTASTLVLRNAQDRTIRIAVGDIESQAVQTTSLMPEGLLRDLSVQQAADLLEYLSSLRRR